MPAAALRTYVEELLAVRGLPGLSLAVTDREGIVASETFGSADVAAGKPVAQKTRFQHGSIGKTFTAIALLQLREEGLVDLDEPVTRYLPWFEVRSEHGPITIHHLLSHTGGIVMGDALSANSRFDVWALRETDTGFPPGARFHYSNVGFRALGHAVEEVSGSPYAQVVRKRILEPLGMRDTDPAVSSATRASLAVGHERWFDDRPSRRSDPWVPAPWLETGTGDGSLAGSAEDLALFLRALLNRGRGLVRPETFDLMATPRVAVEGDWVYGYGLELREVGGKLEIGHGGSMPGFGSVMRGDLDAGLGVVVLVNGMDEDDLSEEVGTAALGLYRDGTGPPSVQDPLVVPNAADFEGRYVGDAGRLDLVAADQRLLLGGYEGIALEPRGEDRFLVDHPRFALFLLRFRRRDGSVVRVTHGEDVYVREGTVADHVPRSRDEWRALPGHYRAYNPWLSNFRVILRGDELVLDWPWWRLEDELTSLSDGSFRVGAEEWSPERLRFDAIVEGRALRASLSGCGDYYRLP